MKRSNLFKIIIRSFLSLKLLVLSMLIYSLIVISCLILLANNIDAHQGIFDLITDKYGEWGSANQNMFMILAIPLIVILLNRIVEQLESNVSILRLGSRFRSWQTHALSAVLLSFLITCIVLGVSFLIGSFLVGVNNTWLSPKGSISRALNNKEKFQSILPNLTTYKIIVTLFITKLLGCLTISFLTLFLKQYIKSYAVSMLILLSIAAIDSYVPLPFPIFTKAASLALMNWIKPSMTIFNCMYLSIVSLVLYAVTGLIHERKDLLS